MPEPLPKEVMYGPGVTMPVVERPLGGRLGCLDTRVPEIVIERDQPEAGKHLILLHELIHLVAERLKAEGLISRQPDEKFVTYLAAGLFPVLAISGLWNGVTPDEAVAFLALLGKNET